MHLAWPPGTETEELSPKTMRQYIRDPGGRVRPGLARRLDTDARLPDDARFTGYRRGDWELWLNPRDDGESVYLVQDGVVERWPRSRPVALCA